MPLTLYRSYCYLLLFSGRLRFLHPYNATHICPIRMPVKKDRFYRIFDTFLTLSPGKSRKNRGRLHIRQLPRIMFKALMKQCLNGRSPHIPFRYAPLVRKDQPLTRKGAAPSPRQRVSPFAIRTKLRLDGAITKMPVIDFAFGKIPSRTAASFTCTESCGRLLNCP